MATTPKHLSLLTFDLVAAETIAAGQLVGINSAGTLNLADADATHSASATNRAIGFAVRGGAAGATIAVSPIGTVSGLSGLTAGGIAYLSATAGGYTTTQPTTATHTVQMVGIATSTSSVAVMMSAPLAAQAAGTTTVAFR